MKSFNNLKNIVTTTNMLSLTEIQFLFLLVNTNHKSSGAKEWLQNEFQGCNLPLKDFYTHLSHLRLCHEGKSGKLRQKSPITFEQFLSLREVKEIKFIGAYKSLEGDDEDTTIYIPMYQLMYNDNTRGFKYYFVGKKPVAIAEPEVITYKQINI